MTTPDFDALSYRELSRRRSTRWTQFPPGVLPAAVAELDVPLAEPVARVLLDAVRDGDTGYASPGDLGRAFAGFAARRWGWTVEPAQCWTVGDVMTGVAEALRVLTDRGDGVVVCPPVYGPFSRVVPEVGRTVVPVPLAPDGGLDLAGIAAALAAGARAVLLSSPHNPTGRVWTQDELDALDAVTREHDAVVVSDEVHAPLTLPGAEFTPFLRHRERHGVAVVSASKAFNLAGLKAALVVAGSPRVQDCLTGIPDDAPYRAGHLGVLAGIAAWDDGDAWLDALVAHLDRNRRLLADLLADQLPEVGYVPPQASYLAWLDARRLGEDPAGFWLEHAGVGLAPGAEFGAAAGWARLNIGTTRALVEEMVERMARAVRAQG